MTTIVPRWEWRTFAPGLRSADAVFAGLQPSAVAESDETYFLSAGGENVKVRDELIDIKVLREVDADGLERWEPVLKHAFPLSAEHVATVFASLKLPAPAMADGPVSLADLRAAVDAQPGGRSVDVHKSRVRYTVGGCMAERSELIAGGRRTTTIAVESTDAAAVVAAVASLGLADYLNTNYLDGLAAALDDVPARYAVIDVGTNSVKFHIGERGADGSWRTVVDRADVTRLGEGLAAGGGIQPEPLERTIAAIAAMAAESRASHALAIAAVGTEGLRQATNAREVTREIKRRTGVHVEVIPGEEEGRLAYLAVRAGLGAVEGRLAIFDTGGGSSQFTFGDGDHVEEQFSVPVGAVRFTERFRLDLPVSNARLHEAMAAIAADLGRLDGRPQPDVLVGMGGAITNITAVKHEMATYDPEVVQGSILDRAEIDRQIDLYRTTDADGRRSIVGLQPKRAEVILAGACVVRTVMDKLGKDSLTVSDRGLRHGVLVELFGGSEARA
jgi:exopolyphosphatase/guanosine-5'-triphosphate,3'-diphosphate pyrophosphatase